MLGMSSSSRRRIVSPPRSGVGKLRMDRQPIVTRISGIKTNFNQKYLEFFLKSFLK